MIYPVFCVRDTKVGFDTQFIVQNNEISAIRGFSYMINNPGTMTHFSPADFELYKIAEFDTESGVMAPVQPAQFIVGGVNVLNEK